MRSDGKSFVMFKDGASGRYLVYLYEGAAIAGDPTAYVYRNGEMVWVSPGDSVEWMEA